MRWRSATAATEYDFEIDADTGTILSRDMDYRRLVIDKKPLRDGARTEAVSFVPAEKRLVDGGLPSAIIEVSHVQGETQ